MIAKSDSNDKKILPPGKQGVRAATPTTSPRIQLSNKPLDQKVAIDRVKFSRKNKGWSM